MTKRLDYNKIAPNGAKALGGVYGYVMQSGLPAELVRDNALAVSGLLAVKIGGRSVKPYQPPGLWEELAGGAGEAPYVQDKAPMLYRRSLYVYRKRTVPHPAMATFDAPSGEVCQVKRPRTNTPLQALELLNDLTYVEAARHLAHALRHPRDVLHQAGRFLGEQLACGRQLQTIAAAVEQQRVEARLELARRMRDR